MRLGKKRLANTGRMEGEFGMIARGSEQVGKASEFRENSPREDWATA